MKLVVSLKKAKVLEAARSGQRYNITRLIEDVPSAAVVSGDPAFAVSVEVEEGYADLLRRSVAEFCTCRRLPRIDGARLIRRQAI